MAWAASSYVGAAVVGGTLLSGALSGSSSPPDVDPRVGEAAMKNAQTGADMLDFNKTVYEENKPRQAKLDALAEQVVNQQLDIGNKNSALAQDYTDYMKTTFRPVERNLSYEASGITGKDATELESLYNESTTQASGIKQQRIADLTKQLDEMNRPMGGIAGAAQAAMGDKAAVGSPKWKLQKQLEEAKSSEVSMADTPAFAQYNKRLNELRGTGENLAMEKAAGEAGVDVATSFEAGRGAQLRDMQRTGVNPNSGAYLSADTGSRVMEAATRAKAMNDARTNAKNLGWAKKMDVANVGRNLPSNQATSAGIALNAGNSAVNNSVAPMNAANANASQMNAGYSGAVNANSSAGNLYLGQYGAQMQGYNAQQAADAAKWSGVGQLATTGYMMSRTTSSKKLKHNKEKINAEAVLKGLKKLPVEKWDYKKGVEDEGRHIGAYAEDVRAAFGEEAAPGGKKIDIVSMIGINMLAIKGLSKQVDRIERKMKTRNLAEVVRHGL